VDDLSEFNEIELDLMEWASDCGSTDPCKGGAPIMLWVPGRAPIRVRSIGDGGTGDEASYLSLTYLRTDCDAVKRKTKVRVGTDYEEAGAYRIDRVQTTRDSLTVRLEMESVAKTRGR